MDRYSGNRWLPIFRFVFTSSRAWSVLGAAAVWAALLGFDPFDPTVLNAVSPAGGVRNWLGLPGALIGGSLIDLIGAASLVLPLLILNWGFARQGRPRLPVYAWYGASLLLIVAAFLGFSAGEPRAELWSAGLLGRSGALWVVESVGFGFGIALLGVGFAFAFGRVVYVVNWQARGREAGILLRAAFGSGEAQAERAALAAMSGGVRFVERIDGAIAAIGAGVTGARLAVRSRVRGALSWITRTRLPRPRLSPVRATARPNAPRPAAPRPSAPPPPFPLDGFHSWFATVDEVEAATRDAAPSAEAPVIPPPTPPHTAHGTQPAPETTERPVEPSETPPSVEWEKQFRAYSDNLDLDWEERVLKVNRMRRELFKWDDEDDDAGTKGGGKANTG